MGTQVKHWRLSLRLAAAALTVAGLTAVTYAASAASLGGINRAEIHVWSALDTVPFPLAYDHFDSCSGSLNGDLDVLGNPWEASSNHWECDPANSRVRYRRTHTATRASIDVGRSDHLEISTYLERTSRGGRGPGSGVSLFDGGLNNHMYLVYQRGADRIVLGKREGSGDFSVATATWLPRSDTIEFRVVIDQPVITVYADGTQVITHTMTAAELAAFGSNTRFGLESDDDSRSRWSWFQVDPYAP